MQKSQAFECWDWTESMLHRLQNWWFNETSTWLVIKPKLPQDCFCLDSKLLSLKRRGDEVSKIKRHSLELTIQKVLFNLSLYDQLSLGRFECKIPQMELLNLWHRASLHSLGGKRLRFVWPVGHTLAVEARQYAKLAAPSTGIYHSCTMDRPRRR